MFWTDGSNKEVERLPDKTHGFIYEIEYESGKKYMGKKKAISVKNLKAKLNGEPREGHIRFFNRIVKRKRTKYEEVKSESNWRGYEGSSDKIEDGDNIIKKTILLCVDNESALTYYEAKFLFALGCIENDKYYNESIFGRLFHKATCGKIKI